MHGGSSIRNMYYFPCLRNFKKYYEMFPDRDYGVRFSRLMEEISNDSNSFGNGAAMRISSVGYIKYHSIDAVVRCCTESTHNHELGQKGASVAANCIHLIRTNQRRHRRYSKEQIYDYVNNYYNIDFNLDEIRDSYTFDETCEGTVPYAIKAFLESESYEDAIRNAISIGGDSDTIACITGGIAEAYYGRDENMVKIFFDGLDNSNLTEEQKKVIIDVVAEFDAKFRTLDSDAFNITGYRSTCREFTKEKRDFYKLNSSEYGPDIGSYDNSDEILDLTLALDDFDDLLSKK